MPRESDKYIKKDFFISQTPRLQADIREQRKTESFKMIFQALEHRFEENKKSKE